MASTIVSLEIIIIGIMIEIVPSLASKRKIVLINSLSAIGSANLPKVVINLDFLATAKIIKITILTSEISAFKIWYIGTLIPNVA